MRSRLRRKNKERKIKNKFLIKLLLPAFFLLLVVAVFLFFAVSPRVWNGKDKVSVTVRRTNGDVSVVVMDPRLDEITTLTIPGATEVEVAENLGLLKMSNVWKLGLDQKIGGKLISETVTKNFLFPSFLWSDVSGEALVKPSLSGLVKFVFDSSTNVSLQDRISLSWFCINTKLVDRTEVDLGKSQFLKKGKLSDGTSGYVLSGDISERLTANFADYGFSDRTIRIFIKDATGEYGVSDKFGQILEVLGGKVASIDKTSAVDSDCVVSGGDSDLVNKVSRLFSCKKIVTGDKEDLNIILGSKFAKRF